MKNHLLIMTVILLTIFSVSAFGQAINTVGQSSEWEGTGFNNGRKVVKDTNGYYHIVWHTQNFAAAAPSGTNCNIFYACIDHMGAVAVPPQNMTNGLAALSDNRYPSIAIEYDGVDAAGSWLNYNTVHIVWQGMDIASGRYQVFHHSIAVANPPVAPGPFVWATCHNLSNSPAVDSLVPAIAVNKFNPDPNTGQQIHVVWQEEDVNGLYGSDLAYSEIFYSQSADCGATWSASRNLTNTGANSQMPSISCALDTYYGTPPQYAGNDSAYLSDDVHVSYHEDIGAGINVFYLRSLNNGAAWNAPINITGNAALREGYTNIAVDMEDRAHIVCMTNLNQNEPLMASYQPGLDPNNIVSFPGPDPGMFHAIQSGVKHYGYGPNLYLAGSANYDREFPTVSLDRGQHLDFNYSEHNASAGFNTYDIMRTQCFNGTAVSRPLGVPAYGPWNIPFNDTADPDAEYLFPNLAHKKVSMYFNPLMMDDNTFTEVWTRVPGVGRPACVNANRKYIQEHSISQRDPGYY